LPILYRFFLGCFSIHAQVDSLRLVCKPTSVNYVVPHDLLWMYRQRDTLRYHGAVTNLQVSLNGQQVSLHDSISLRYLASLQANYPALDSIYASLLQAETMAFALQKDSLLVQVSKLGWSMRYLQAVRNLQRQQQLNRSGRSQVLLSFHNFNLAADVGLYSHRRYLRRSPRYLRMGQMAKSLGMFWGGDFVGFPDPGHVQGFVNSATFIQKYPFISFEFERYRNDYQQAYRKKKSLGRVDLVKDTEALLISMNRQRIGQVCACQYAIIPVGEYPSGEQAKVMVNTQQNWVFIQPKDSNGYYYSLGRWAYEAKN